MANYYDDVYKALENAYKEQKKQLEQNIGAAKYEAGRRTYMDLARAGIRGPIATALARKAESGIVRQAVPSLSNLAASKFRTTAQLKQTEAEQQRKEKLMRDIAQQQMWGQIWQGLGSLAGSALTSGALSL